MKRVARHLSLTPGFSPVCAAVGCQNRFNGFPRTPDKPLKRFFSGTGSVTGLKPGVNESQAFADTNALEWEIDQQACALYGLTPEAIKLVEGQTK